MKINCLLFQNIFLAMAGISFTGWLITFPVLLLTVGRKFDKLFKDRRPFYDPDIPIFSTGLRASKYAGCCISSRYNNAPFLKILYDNYNFKEASTKIDKIISFIYYLSLIMFGASGISYYVTAYIIPFILKIL